MSKKFKKFWKDSSERANLREQLDSINLRITEINLQMAETPNSEQWEILNEEKQRLYAEQYLINSIL